MFRSKTRSWPAKGLTLAILVASLGFSASAHASDAGPGSIHNIYIMENGVVLFHLTGARTALPACGTYFPSRWAFDSTTPAGQAKLSFLLTAYTSQKPIAIHGTAACPHWTDTETVSHFMTAD